ncbi:MAG: nucleotidyltransferase family protein [Clostridia bacterium]
MKITAIICEYNPFTNGHLKHIKLAKEQTNADTIICIMSGSFTQRGDAAILDKYQRSYIACRYGADMVIELPLIYAISPAENFAYGAVKILHDLPKIDFLSFGSECGDKDLLIKTNNLFENEPEEFKKLLKDFLAEGYSYPRAKSCALQEFCKLNKEYEDIQDILEKPNNVLGLSYIKAIKTFNMDIGIHTIKRNEDYNNEELTNDFPSASSIRVALEQNKLDKIKNSIPQLTYDYLSSYNLRGTSLGDLCLFKLKDINGHDLANYYDFNAGLNNRLKMASLNATTFDEFLTNAKSKNITMTRLKRLSLYTLFDITKDMYKEICDSPTFVSILAINKERKELISWVGTTCKNILTKYSDIDRIDKSLRQIVKLDLKAQGCLSIINRTNYYNKSMLLV